MSSRALFWAPWPWCYSPGACGHTHHLLVPAWLAEVLEAGKLAITSGPAVLIDDALLGGQRAALSGKAGQQAHVPWEGQSSVYPPASVPWAQAAGTVSDTPQCPAAPSPVQLAPWHPTPPPQAGGAPSHTARRGFCSLGCHAQFTQLPLCAASAHTPRVGSRDAGPIFSTEQTDLIKKANGFQAPGGCTGGAEVQGLQCPADQEGRGWPL